jgi:hypothetical protein
VKTGAIPRLRRDKNDPSAHNVEQYQDSNLAYPVLKCTPAAEAAPSISLEPAVAAVIKMTEETLDSRVARLESDVSFIRTDVADIKADLRQMRGEMTDLRKDTHAEFVGVRGEIANLRKDTHAEFASVRGEIADLRKDTHAEFAGVRGEIADLRKDTHAEFAGVRGEMSAGFKELRGEITRQFRWLVGLMIMMALSLIASIITVTHQPGPDRNTHGSPTAAVSPAHRPVTRQPP